MTRSNYAGDFYKESLSACLNLDRDLSMMGIVTVAAVFIQLILLDLDFFILPIETMSVSVDYSENRDEHRTIVLV